MRICSPSALETLFDITQKLVLNQKHEIKQVFTIEWQFTHWMRSTLLHDKVIKLSKAKVHVCTRLFWFRSLSGEDVRAYRSRCKVERSTSRLPTVQRILSSSGICSQGLQHCRFSIEDRIILHVHVQRYWLDKESSKGCFSSEKVKNYAERFILRSRREQMVWNAPTTHLKESGVWRQMWKIAKTVDIQYPSYQFVELGVLEKKRWKMYDPLQCRPLFCTIHSANQLSIYGAVASWCEELAQLISGQTHLSMEKSVAKANDQLYQKLEGTDTKWRVVKWDKNNSSLWSAGFMRRVSIGIFHKTIHDVDDGFEGATGACREDTLPREDPDSEIIAWIGLHVFLISTESKYRYRQHQETDPEHSLSCPEGPTATWKSYNTMIQIFSESRELANHTSVGKPHATSTSTAETRASQQKTQSNLMNNHSCLCQREDCGFQNLDIGYEVGSTCWPCRSRNLWCSSLGFDGSKAATRVSRSLILIGLNFSSAIQGHTRGELIALIWWIMSPLRSDGMNSCVTVELYQRHINPSSRTHRSWKRQERRATNGIKTHLWTMQKKKSTTIYRGREKYTLTVNGSLIRTPPTGSTWRGHKKQDCSFGRQGLALLWFTSPGRRHRKGSVLSRRQKTLFLRVSTLRPASKTVLKDAW